MNIKLVKKRDISSLNCGDIFLEVHDVDYFPIDTLFGVYLGGTGDGSKPHRQIILHELSTNYYEDSIEDCIEIDINIFNIVREWYEDNKERINEDIKKLLSS